MNPEDFEKFLKDFMAGKGGDAAELAAMTTVANVLLNLNETITK